MKKYIDFNNILHRNKPMFLIPFSTIVKYPQTMLNINFARLYPFSDSRSKFKFHSSDLMDSLFWGSLKTEFP